VVKPIARLDRSSQMWGGLSGGETLRPELPADPAPEFSQEALGKIFAVLGVMHQETLRQDILRGPLQRDVLRESYCSFSQVTAVLRTSR